MASLKIKGTSIRTVVFDFDGTLAKLNIDFARMRAEIQALISSYNVGQACRPADYVLETIDNTEMLLRKHSRKKAEAFRVKATDIIETIETEAAMAGNLFPSSKDLLVRLASFGIAVGIITRNCEKALTTVFPDISIYCSVVLCRNGVQRVKPHPEHLDTALRVLNGTPGTTLMVGDHPLDILCGRNAGTYTAGVLTGRSTKLEFLNAGADLILAQAADILDLISN